MRDGLKEEGKEYIVIENKTCQHYFPLNKYVPPEEASRHCLNCETNVSDCLTVNLKERREAIWQCQSCPRGKFGYQTKAISLWKGCQDCKTSLCIIHPHLVPRTHNFN